MTQADRPRFAMLLSILGESFNEPISEIRAEAYFIALTDLSIDALESVRVAALNGKFFPRPRELRELIEPGEWDRRRELAQMHAYLNASAERKKLKS